MTGIWFFVKFVEREEFAQQMVAGRLWLNPLRHFVETEEGDDARGDKYEAVTGWHQPSSLLEISIGNVTVPAADLAAPLVIRTFSCDSLNIFSLYAATPGDPTTISDDNLEEFRERMRVPEACCSMGPIAVVITNARKFQERVVAAVQAQGFGLRAGLVEYFDPETHSGGVTRPAFAKRRDYAWQREYRFAIDRGTSVASPYTLDVGPLEDICRVVESRTINTQLAITRKRSP